MKRQIIQIVLILTVFLSAACSKENIGPNTDESKGIMSLSIATRGNQDEATYDPLQYLQVRIFNNEGGLLRKYTKVEEVAQLELLAGNYRVTVEAGEEVPASFTKRFYKADDSFTVKAKETTSKEVVCKIVNTVVEVKFDDSILEKFDPGYFAWVAAGDEVDVAAAESGDAPALKFTEEGVGYYTLPAGTTSLSWLFNGMSKDGTSIEMKNSLSDVKPAAKYVLTFKYSPDLPGFIDCILITVDESTDDKDDEIIFSPDPSITGENFSSDELQKYESGDKNYRVMAFSKLNKLTVTIDDVIYDVLTDTTSGISTVVVDKYNTLVVLSDALFAGYSAGDHMITVAAEDAKGGKQVQTTVYRLQGLVPVAKNDYNLWANTVTLKAVSFAPSSNIEFKLQDGNGSWQTLNMIDEGDGLYTATYSPEWEQKDVADWSTPATVLPYSRLKEGTGISAGKSYSYKATIDGAELNDQFTAEAGNAMTDGSLETWRSAQQFPGKGTNYTFWGSGYNSFAKNLCTRDDLMLGRDGTYCAKLSATYNTLAKVPAPGNLFTGDFGISLVPMGGNVSFGKNFEYNARPRAIRFRYHATIGNVDYNLFNGKIAVGEMDKSRVFVSIVDWSAQQKVFAGKVAPTGTWDPETQTSADNGPIIGYASKFIDATTPGDEMVEVTIPINYYQDTATAPQGPYNIVVSCSSSAYGDYMNACTTNVMYVDDFEWVY